MVHSALTDAERAAEWRRIRSGEHTVVIGSRSAVFAPVADLGIVVVDEEDAPAYKQDRVPRYHAVDVALMLGALCTAPVVMGSATPRVESFFRAHTGDLELATLPERVSGRPLPPIEVVDLRDELKAGNTNALSLTLDRAMQECHAEGGQSILFLNRRGTSTVVLCRTLRRGADLPQLQRVAGAPRGSRELRLPLLRPVDPACRRRAPRADRAPSARSAWAPSVSSARCANAFRRCASSAWIATPRVRVTRTSTSTTASARHEADCLIGTQMVAKGWDLGNVRLVGIVNADTSLHFPDYRSGELTFSLLTQVAGRAGRGDEPARVVLQTYSPGHYAVRHATTHDYLGFARRRDPRTQGTAISAVRASVRLHLRAQGRSRGRDRGAPGGPASV